MPASARLRVWRTQNTADSSEEEQASSKSSILTDNRVFLSKGERKRECQATLSMKILSVFSIPLTIRFLLGLV